MGPPFRSLYIKYLLFIFNLIFVLSGIILLVVGLVIQAYYSEYDPVLDEGFFSVPVLLISIGTIIFVVSFFGCSGAYMENYCLTKTFCLSLVLIFILEFSGCIAGYLLRDRVASVVESQLNLSMRHYNETQYHTMWDEMQRNLHCCGDSGAKSWIKIMNSLPSSCCEDLHVTCTEENAFKDSCMTGLKNLLENYAGILGGVAVGIAAIQLLGIIFACNLASSIRDYESV